MTIRQDNVIKEVVENSRNKPLNKGKILSKAGYPKNTQIKPSQVFNSKGVKEGLKPIIQQLEKKRQMAINRLTGRKMDSAMAKDLTDIMDKLTKNIQLLGGGVTERTQVVQGFNYQQPEKTQPHK